MIKRYARQDRVLIAVDCVIFGFDGKDLKILLIKRGFEPEKGNWSLMGGFVHGDESCENAAARVLKELTGLENVYMEQMHSFSDPNRDPIERTLSVTFFTLIDIDRYETQINAHYQAEWFSLQNSPDLIFDHTAIVDMARKKLRYKAALHPILFELLPGKFTLPQLQTLYEGVYGGMIDKRNFSRKVLSTQLLVKQKDKDKESSKRGAFYYKLNKKKYNSKFHTILNFIPNPRI